MFASSTLSFVIQEIPQNYITTAFGVFSHLTFFSRVLCANMHFKCRAEVEEEVAPLSKTIQKHTVHSHLSLNRLKIWSALIFLYLLYDSDIMENGMFTSHILTTCSNLYSHLLASMLEALICRIRS